MADPRPIPPTGPSQAEAQALCDEGFRPPRVPAPTPLRPVHPDAAYDDYLRTGRSPYAPKRPRIMGE